jgi:predicted PurR-regulated permease PerM
MALRLLIQVLYIAAVVWCVVDILKQKRYSTAAAAGLIVMVLLLPVLGPLIYALVRFARPQPAD